MTYREKHERNASIVSDAKYMCVPDIATKYGLSVRTVQKVLKLNGVNERVRKESIDSRSQIETGYVYQINIAQYVYIGSTVDLATRANTHRSQLRVGTHPCKFMQMLYNKFPELVVSALDNLAVIDVLHNVSHKELLQAERAETIHKAVIGASVINGILGEIEIELMNQRKHYETQI